MRAALVLAALLLTACDGRAANTADSEPSLSPGRRLARAAGARGEAPSGDYACVLVAGSATRPYGDLAVRGSAYRLRLAEGGRVLAGQLHSTPAGRLIWNGRLGPIDAPPRGILRAEVKSSEDAIRLEFEFGPALPGSPPSTLAVCRMDVGASI